jgi:glutamate N-acetyltransferase / amino-acid N-acetyltransferase
VDARLRGHDERGMPASAGMTMVLITRYVGDDLMLEWIEGGTITTPRGFRAGAVYAGLKTPGPDKLDVGVILSDAQCAVAGVFTSNKLAAAPVVVSRERVARGWARGIAFNAGNANAATGEEGMARARQMAESAGERFGVAAEELLVASTGIIGVPLPIDKFRRGIEQLEVSPDGGHLAARCIVTTDTHPKETAVRVSGDGFEFTVGAIAKGAGMIHPNVATMFCFVTTDAAADPGFLDGALRKSADISFNMISIDGDMSTNDTVFCLANGESGAPKLEAGSEAAAAFQEALDQVCIRMAKMIAADGEGATKLIEATVEGAANEHDARLAARAIVSSNLLKCAVHGADPNWGRIACAAGYSGASLEESLLDITIAGVPVLRQGTVQPFDKASASRALRAPEISIVVNLNLGNGRATAWGCDLTQEYVVVNSEYTT